MSLSVYFLWHPFTQTSSQVSCVAPCIAPSVPITPTHLMCSVTCLSLSQRYSPLLCWLSLSLTLVCHFVPGVLIYPSVCLSPALEGRRQSVTQGMPRPLLTRGKAWRGKCTGMFEMAYKTESYVADVSGYMNTEHATADNQTNQRKCY